MFSCPKCKSTNLEVTVEVWAKLIQTPHEDDEDSRETDLDGALDHDHEWTSNSPMHCMDCAHFDIAGSFNEEDRDDEDEAIQQPAAEP